MSLCICVAMFVDEREKKIVVIVKTYTTHTSPNDTFSTRIIIMIVISQKRGVKP